jgi:hypothetical protein
MLEGIWPYWWKCTNGEIHIDVFEIEQDCKEETARQKISLRISGKARFNSQITVIT